MRIEALLKLLMFAVGVGLFYYLHILYNNKLIYGI